MAGETIGAIDVKLGVDLSNVSKDLQRIPKHIDVKVRVGIDGDSLNRVASQIHTQLHQNFDRKKFNVPINVDRAAIRNFRRDMERQLQHEGQAGRIHIPIQGTLDRNAKQSIVSALSGITIDIHGRWAGWEGGGPTEGGAPTGGGPGPAPRRGGGGGKAKPAPTTPTQAPAPAPTPQAQPAPVATGRPQTGQKVRGATAAPAPATPIVQAPAEPEIVPPVAGPSQRRRQRRAAAVKAAPAPQAAANGPQPSAPPRAPSGAPAPGAYVDPEGGRVHIGNVRGGRVEEELQGEERAEFISQQRARPTPASGLGPQPDEPVRSPADRARTAKHRHRNEIQARWDRRKESRARRSNFASDLASIDPELGGMFDALTDREVQGAHSFEDFSDAVASRKKVYHKEFHGMSPRARRRLRRARGTTKNFDPNVDPRVLVLDAALDAARQFQQNAVDPLGAIRSGDNKLRGKGGKPGKIGGTGAGRLASESRDPAIDQAIRDAKRQGASWKDLRAQYGGGPVGRIQAEQRARRAPEPLEEPEFYAGATPDETPPVPGGQGLFDRTPPSKGPRARSRAREDNLGYAEGMRPDAGPSQKAPPPPPPPPRTDYQQARQQKGSGEGFCPQCGAGPFISREYLDRHIRSHGGASSGARRRSEYAGRPASESDPYRRRQGPGFSAYEATQAQARKAQGESSRVKGLKAMASQDVSPNERDVARGILRRLRIPGFAEGGLLHFAEGGKNPYLRGVRGIYSRQIGQSFGAPEGHENVAHANLYDWKKTRAAQIRRQPYCAHCGIGASEARSAGIPLTADKIKSQAQGGDPFDQNNLQTLCRNCNSRKSGSSVNPAELWTGPRPRVGGAHPWFGKISVDDWLPGGRFFQAKNVRDMQARKKDTQQRAEGGVLHFAEGGLFSRLMGRGSKMQAQPLEDLGWDGEAPHATHKATAAAPASMLGSSDYGRLSEPPKGYERVFRGGRAPRYPEGRLIQSAADTSGRTRYGTGAYVGIGSNAAQIAESYRPKGGVVESGLVESSRVLNMSSVPAEMHTPIRQALRIRDDEPVTHHLLQRHLEMGGRNGGMKQSQFQDALRQGGYHGYRYPYEGGEAAVMFDPTAVVPEHSDVRGIPKIANHAEGGYVKHGGLLQRMAQAGHQPSVAIVGERGPEAIVSDPHTGQSEVIPTHKLPSWLARARDPQGMGATMGMGGKDLTHRAEGGLTDDELSRAGLRRIRMPSGGSRYQGPGGKFVGEAAAQHRVASAGGPGIQRVVITNWPPGFQQMGQYFQGLGSAAGARARSAFANAPAPGTPPPGGAGAGAPPAPGAGAPGAGAGAGAPPPPPRGRRGRGAGAGAGAGGGAGGGGAAPGAGAGAPAGAPTPGATGGRGIDPLVRVRAREFASRGELDPTGLQGRIALSVALGQIAQTAVGGRAGILERARGASVATARAQRAQSEVERLDQRRFELTARIGGIRSGSITPRTPTELAELRQERSRTFEARQRQSSVAEQRTGRAEELQKGILSRGQQIRAQGVGLGGILAGSQLFNLGIGAAGAGEEAISRAAGPLVDQMTGWSGAIDRVTGSIRDNIQALRSEGAVRQAAATAALGGGLGAGAGERLVQPAAERAQIQAASRIQAQATDLARASSGLGSNRNNPLFSGTGGLFGGAAFAEQLGGQSGFLENVVGELRAVNPNQVPRNILPSGPGAPGGRGIPGSQLLDTSAIGTGVEFDEQGNITSRPAGVPNLPGPNPAFGDLQKKQADAIQDLNDALKRAAESAHDTASAFEVTTTATEAETKAMVDSAKQIGGDAGKRAEELAAAGATVRLRGGGGLQGQDFARFAQQLAQGRVIQDPSLLLRQTEPQRRAQAFRMRAGAEATRHEDLPAQFALQEIADPSPRFGSTFSTRGLGGGSTAGVRRDQQETTSQIAKYEQIAGRAGTATKSIADGLDEGRKAMQEIVGRLGPQALGEFNNLVGQIGDMGQQISGITEHINMRQVNLQVAEYDNEIRMANRSLGDARDLWSAINGRASKTLGGLQGQNILIERQNQLLSRRAQSVGFKSEDVGFRQAELQLKAQSLQMDLSQRQINFNKAIAGFTVPGLTPEEQAARVEQAKVEADYAQKQLDIQKEVAKGAREQLGYAREQAGLMREIAQNTASQQDNQFAITKEEASRAVTDIQNQLALLQKGRAITIDTAGAEAAIQRLTKAQSRLISQAQTYLEEGQKARDAVLDDTASLMATTGKGFGELVGQVSKAWSGAFSSYYSNFYLPLVRGLQQLSTATGGRSGQAGPATRGSGTQGGSAKFGHTPTAAGAIATVNAPTRFLAGDAGTEHVIVMRNARAGMGVPAELAGGGGGGGVSVGSINVTVTGTASHEDAEEIGDRIASRVEERLSRKLQMLGGRTF
jgi:hypothetical protein